MKHFTDGLKTLGHRIKDKIRIIVPYKIYVFSKFNFSNNEKAKEFITKLAHVNYKSLMDVPEFDEIASKDYIKYLVEFATVLELPLKVLDSKYHLEQTITEMGICYSFNSQLTKYSSPK